MAEKRRKETIDIGKGMAWTTGQGTRDATTEGTADNTSLIFFFVLYFFVCTETSQVEGNQSKQFIEAVVLYISSL